ncbi:MAG: hypothetical protein Q8916_00820 [Bacteroidota bacterium]|nr:hypothetical protein [Bacteroidota bacterium]MDP4228928.1 hypothetical protein [Bacteroidota bacterium]MDP4236706.1 hypothetical protein [Bacteroidota bacterium]
MTTNKKRIIVQSVSAVILILTGFIISAQVGSRDSGKVWAVIMGYMVLSPAIYYFLKRRARAKSE